MLCPGSAPIVLALAFVLAPAGTKALLAEAGARQRPPPAEDPRSSGQAVQTPGLAGLSLERPQNRVELLNFKDLQYYSEIRVGTPPQKLTGIIDTGSFELVLFSKKCQDCGSANAYDPQASKSYHPGSLANVLTYGSGDVEATQAWDEVAIGPFQPKEQHFWEGSSASMPVLSNARFQSIIGIGPPETPARDAWGFTKNSIGSVKRHFGSSSNEQLLELLVSQVKQDLAMALSISQSKPMLSNFEVRTFSVCLGKRPGSNGVFIWNDTAPLQAPELFHRLPVVGRHTWTVRMTSAHLSERIPTLAEQSTTALPGCTGGCGAILDSGTSLLVMPTDAVDAFVRALRPRIGPNCSNLHELPNVVFALNGVEFSLSPDAYMGQVSGNVPVYMEDIVRIRRAPLTSWEGSGQCEVAVMESFSKTAYGPLWILGMPFFRKYYTTFDVGSSLAERSLYVALASDSCTPLSPKVPAALVERELAVHRREIDLSHVLPPSVLRKAGRQTVVQL